MDATENGELPTQAMGFIPGHGDSIPVYGEHGIIGWMEPLGGLTERKEFAKAAMAGLLANSGGPIQANGMSGWNFCNCDAKQVAETAVDLADALLRALAHSAGGEA